MRSIGALALGLCVFSITTFAAPAPAPAPSPQEAPQDNPVDVTALVKAVVAAAQLSVENRDDLANKVCGNDGDPPAADTQSQQVWKDFKIGDWFTRLTKEAEDGGLKYDDGGDIPDVQSLVLKAAEEGKSKCNTQNLAQPQCTGDGMDFNKCRKNPEAHLVWISLVNWAVYCTSMFNTLETSIVDLQGKTGKMVGWFYTPQKDPAELILPVSAVGGLAAALSVIWPPAAIGAGAASVVTGALTQAGLNKFDPLEQWQAVQDAVSGSFEDIRNGIQAIYRSTLGNKDGPDYSEKPAQLPSILYEGGFVKPSAVDVVDPDIYAAISAVAINALWLQDRVFIVKLSDKAYNKGNGEACKAFPGQTICIDNNAFIVGRWVWDDAFAVGEGAAIWASLDWGSFFAWGAYDGVGKANGEDNVNHLSEFNINLESVVRRSIYTQGEKGFLYQNQTDLTVQSINDANLDLTAADLTYWNLPICDIDKAIGEGKFLKSDYEDGSDNDDAAYKLLQWVGCTCLLIEGWPIKEYPDSLEIGKGAGWLDEECKDKGWGDI